MKVKADQLTSIFGLLGSLLVIQQTYLPELLPDEAVAPIAAALIGSYGISTNKQEVEVPLTNRKKKQDKIDQLEKEIKQLTEELRGNKLYYPKETDE